MKLFIEILIIFLLSINYTFGQSEWIYLNDNLKQIENIDSADIKIQYLLDSSDLKVYRAIDINNEYYGFIHKKVGNLQSTQIVSSYDSSHLKKVYQALDIRNEYYGFIYSKDDKLQFAQIVFNYDSGQLKSIGTFQNGVKEGLWTDYFYNGQIDNCGEYIKGKLNGEWIWYFENGQMSSRELYEMGELKSVEMWDESGKQVAVPENNIQMPRLKIDDRDLQSFRYITYKEMRYPEKALKNKIEGKVVVQFSIDKNGNLHDEHVIKGVSKDLDEEALRVTRLADKWIPGLSHNRPANFRFTYTISFMMN